MKTRGFTLVELITVLVLVGILAVAALPRFFDQNVFESRGFFDETKAQLRYAQKAAIAQRRTVCVALAGTGVTLRIVAARNSADCSAASTLALALPNANPRGGVGLDAQSGGNPLANFQFTSLGGTTLAANAIITVAGATGQITVDRVTGYVD